MTSGKMLKSGVKLVGSTRSPSKAQQAYIGLKDMIVRLAIRPGDVIREDALMEQMGIGRTPLREALQRLAQERFLQVFPRRLIIVAKFGIEDLRHIYEARLALEPSAASRAAHRVEHATEEDVRALEHARLAGHDLVSVADFLERNLTFHRLVARLSGNPFLQEDIDHILSLNHWMWNFSYEARGIRQVYPTFHDPIVGAIQARDASAAEQAMREDIATSQQELLPGLP